jgi:hypothetical protein
LITAQEVTGLNPVEVTNEFHKRKKSPSSLEGFFCFMGFSKRSFAGCCVAKSSRGHKHQIIFYGLVFFIYKILFCNNLLVGMREGVAKVAPCNFGDFL